MQRILSSNFPKTHLINATHCQFTVATYRNPKFENGEREISEKVEREREEDGNYSRKNKTQLSSTYVQTRRCIFNSCDPPWRQMCLISSGKICWGLTFKIDYVVAKQMSLQSLKNSLKQWLLCDEDVRIFVLLNDSFKQLVTDEEVRQICTQSLGFREVVFYVEDLNMVNMTGERSSKMDGIY